MSENTNSSLGRARPLSPHLQVYKPQITTILSITHRATACFLYIGAFVFANYMFSYAFMKENIFRDMLSSHMGRLFVFAALMAWSFATFYHFCNGIRHLFWDMGKGYEIENVYRSGYTVMIASVALTLLTWIYILVI